MHEIVTWASIGAAVTMTIAIIRFWQAYSDRITLAEGKATAAAVQAALALEVAQEAKVDAHESSQAVSLLSTTFGLYREGIARDYVNREAMREVEGRLTEAIGSLGERVDRFASVAMKNAGRNPNGN